MITVDDLRDSGHLCNFNDLQEEVQGLADLNYPDRVVDMRTTHVTPTLDLQVPGMGILELTPWSKSQLSSFLGVRWDKWFENIDYSDVQVELQRRFARTENPEFLLRGRQHKEGEKKGQNQGVLRGFLSPTYNPIDDVQILEALGNSEFGKHFDDVAFVTWKGRTRFTDKSTHITGIIGDVVNLPHYKNGDKSDPYYHGVHFRNSEVGFSSVTIDDFWFRVECTNGMISMIQGEHLFRRNHTNTTTDQLIEGFSGTWDLMMDRHERTADALEDAFYDELVNPDRAMRNFLRKRNIAKYLIDLVGEKVAEDEVNNRLGVVQSITAAARAVSDPDIRRDLELAGGAFLKAA